MDKVSVMREDAIHLAHVQRYLVRWAAWWARTASPVRKSDCLKRWSQRAERVTPEHSWLGTGLLWSGPELRASALR